MNNLLKRVVSSVALFTMLFALVPTTFAATISEGSLVKASGSSAIYLIQDGKKRVFPHSSVYLSWGYPSNYSTVTTVSESELAVYPEGDAVVYRDGFMFRFKGVGMTGGFDPSAVFFVSDGKIRPIESATTYMKLFNGGVNENSAWDRVYWIPDDLLAKFTYAKGANITSAQVDAGTLPNGLVTKDSAGLYYVVNSGKLLNITSTGLSANRYLANSNVFAKMLVTKLADSVLNMMPAGVPVTAADNSLLTVPKLTVTPSATNVILSSDKTSVEADGASYATLTATVPSTVTSVSFAITNGSGMLSAYAVAPVSGVATVRLTPTASSVSGTLTVSASATGLVAASVSVTTVANALAPQVVSVSNQGMQLINVVFDKAVDKSTAETTTNYTPKNNKGTSITVSNAKLLDGGKTVQLKLAAGFYNDSIEDSIEVKNVQNSAQTATMSTVTKVLTVTDTSVPTVVAVEALGSRAVRVTFSEPVNGVAVGAFRMDDKVLDGSAASDTSSQLNRVTVSYPDANDYTKALILFGNGVTVGAHTLTVGSNNAITDNNVTTTGTPNAYTMQAAGYVATVLADTSVPTLSSVEVLSQTKVRFTFSKSVSTPSNNAFFYSTASNATSGTYATSVAKVSDTVYEASWTSAITTGNMYFFAGTSSNNVTDYSGNTISPLPSSRLVTVSSDTAPAISSVGMDTDSDRVVVVMFSKDVDEASAETTSNYVFKSSTGTVLTATTGGNGIGSSGNPITAPVKDGTNAKKVTITLGSSSEDAKALPGGTYQLCVTNVKALSASSSSSMPTSCYTFSVTDKTRPTLKDNSGAALIGTNVFAADAGTDYAGRIVIKYSEPMGSSATDARNYKVLNVTGYTSTATKLSDISGVTLAFRNNNKDVVIDFPNSIELSTSTVLTIGYIEGSTAYAPTDVSGNLFKTSSSDTNVSTSVTLSTVSSAGMDISNNTTGLTALKIKSATTFEATFARNLENVSAAEFLVDNAASADYFQPTSAVICTLANYDNRASTGCEEENESKVMFTIPSGTSYEFTATDTNSNVNFKTQASTLATTKDTLGLIVQAAKTDNVVLTNDIKPVLKAVAMTNSTTLKLVFDGKIKSGEGAHIINDLIVTQTVGTTTTTYTGSQLASTIGADSTVVTVTLASGTLSSIDPVTVRTVSGDSITTVGANNAKIAANTAGVVNASFVAGTITETLAGTLTAGYGYGIAGTEVISTITFNKNVDRSSISGTWTTSDNVTYTMTGVAVTYNGSTNKVNVNGVGDLDFTDLVVGNTKTESATGTATIALNTSTNVLTVTLSAAPSVSTYYAADSIITLTPASGIRTTVGTVINTDYKPVVTTD